MINIAYLIEAHTDVDRLIALCDTLVLSGDVFVHVDKKTKDSLFWNKLNMYVKEHAQVHVMKHRHYVAWAGFSQVKCFETLLGGAISCEKQYDRFVLLSGLDYPVWSPRRILDYFEAHKQQEFVCGYDISTCKFDYQLRKIKYYHFFRDIPLPHKSLLRRSVIGGTMMLLKSLGIHRKPFWNDNGELKHVYFGSSWIGITRSCAEYLMRKLSEDSVIRYFKTVYAPDELCVPTLVMNSPFRSNVIEVKELSFQAVTPLHYLNYEDYIWSYDEKDFDTIVNSGKMFVRKIVSGKSERLVEMIKKSWKIDN